MKDCLFCKIIAGEIPCQKVYEDENCIAFNDISPKAPTHILLVPKTHTEAVHTVSDKNIAVHLFNAVAKIVEEKELADNGYRLVINSGKDGGQTVFHLHIHILGGNVLTDNFVYILVSANTRSNLTKNILVSANTRSNLTKNILASANTRLNLTKNMLASANTRSNLTKNILVSANTNIKAKKYFQGMKKIIITLILFLLSGCAFVNVLYNGGSAYRSAQKAEVLGARMSKDSANIASETSALYKRAIDKADKTLLEYPKSEKAHDDAYFLKGISFFATGEYSSAINVFEVLLEFYPESKYIPRAMLFLAKSFAKIEDFLMAENFINTLLERFPEMETNQEVVMLRADLAVELEGKTAAIAALEKRLAETSDPNYRLIIIERLMGLNMENGDYEKAISYTDEMPAFDKKYSQIYYKIEFRKLQLFRIIYKRDEAIILANKMLDNSSYLYNRSEIMLEKGITLIDMGRYDDAILVFKDIIALQSNPKVRGKAWFEYAGVSIDFKGNLDSGKVQLDSALVLAGDDLEFREQIAKRLNGLNTIASLQAQLDTADVFEKIDSAYYRYRIGEEYWLAADLPDSALLFFDRVIESVQTEDSIRAKSLYSIGYILREIKKDTVAADSIFNEIIEKYPHFEAAKASQEILGLPVTLMTRSDSAAVQFDAAEKMYIENGGEYSSELYYAYLLTAMKYSDVKDIAAKSLFSAGILANKRDATQDGTVDTAVVKIFVRLCDEYPQSEQCEEATAMMNVGEVKSYATQYTARDNIADSLQAVQDSIRISEIPEEERAVLPEFQKWI